MTMSDKQTMRAVRIREPGGPEVLELCEMEVPEPRPDELLVRYLTHKIEALMTEAFAIGDKLTNDVFLGTDEVS